MFSVICTVSLLIINIIEQTFKTTYMTLKNRITKKKKNKINLLFFYMLHIIIKKESIAY